MPEGSNEAPNGKGPNGNASAPPPAYPGIGNKSTRRSSWSARNDPNGSIVRASDVGNGSDTLRPFKKVDAAGSLRLSSDYVGSIRGKDDASPTSPGSDTANGSGTNGSGKSHKRTQSEFSRAGSAMVTEIIVPTIQKVSLLDTVARSPSDLN
jgi:serine/threonine-protein kinase 24/25/MST4